MFGVERLEKIKEILIKEKSINVSDLSEIFSVTEMTIRRDLDKLQEAGFIIKTHGGAVTCASQPGLGTTFDIYLPEIQAAVLPKTGSAKQPSVAGTESILHVDDEETISDVTRQMLQKLGYEVVSTTSSIEAFNVFAEAPERFDLVITDMAMPDLTGDRLAQKIIAIRPDIPVILCTGHSDHMSAEDAARLGIRQFLMKPYDMAGLSEALRRAIDGAGNSKTS